MLPHLLQNAPAAFPKLLAVGKWLEGVDEDTVCNMRDSVLRSAGGKLESRLATQYALTILCALKVKIQMVNKIGIQLVNMAHYKKVNPEAVWEYFQEVIGPEVLELQGQRAPEEMTLGALTLAFVQAAPLSEVNHHIP